MRSSMGVRENNSGLVEKYLGTAYDKVEIVADNIEDVKKAAQDYLSIKVLLEHAQEFAALAGMHNELLEIESSLVGINQLVNNLADIRLIISSLPAIAELDGVVERVNTAASESESAAAQALVSQTAAAGSAAAALASQTAASDSQIAAAASEAAALASQVAAAGLVVAAEDEADAAAASAVAANADAAQVAYDRNIVRTDLVTVMAQTDIARAQAVISTTQAGIATTKADEAAISASAASASATAAAGSATAANISADAAAVSQTASAADAVATAQDRAAVAADRTVVADNLASAVAQADIASAQAGIATTKAGEAVDSVATIPAVMAPHIAQAQAWAESLTAPDADVPGSKSAKTLAGEAAASAAAADGFREAAQMAAAEVQDAVLNLDVLQELAEADHLDNVVQMAQGAGVTGAMYFFEDPTTLALTDTSPAGRALLGQLAGVGPTGMDVIAAFTHEQGLTAMSAVGFIEQTLTETQRTQVRNNIGLASGSTAGQALGIASVGAIPGITGSSMIQIYTQNGERWAILNGSAIAPQSSTGNATITYGFAFMAAVLVNVSNGDSYGTGRDALIIGANTTGYTDFSVTCRTSTTGAAYTGSFRVNFTAIGRIS